MAQTMDRRKFLSLAAGGVALGILIAAGGCDNSSGTTDADSGFNDKGGAISANHGHAITLTAAQQQAGAAVTLTTTGGTHSHSLNLTAANVAAVAAGTRVSGESSVADAHSHTISFN